MMTIFPFEEQLYRDAGVRADFVGHTMVRDIPETADGIFFGVNWVWNQVVTRLR